MQRLHIIIKILEPKLGNRKISLYAPRRIIPLFEIQTKLIFSAATANKHTIPTLPLIAQLQIGSMVSDRHSSPRPAGNELDPKVKVKLDRLAADVLVSFSS